MESVLKQRGEKAPLNIALGIIFDTEKRKILIAKRKNKTNITGLTWCFPGGRVAYEKDLEKELRNKIKDKTGFEVESLGSIFAETHFNNGALLSIYYLCELVGGKEKRDEEFDEIKWISPEDIGNFFEVNSGLKEYLMSLK